VVADVRWGKSRRLYCGPVTSGLHLTPDVSQRCYNFTRVLNILGFERFVACMATILLLPVYTLTMALQCIQCILRAFETPNLPRLAISRPEPTPAA
jgi:hypothetical protein